jgi:hypothetical protein
MLALQEEFPKPQVCSQARQRKHLRDTPQVVDIHLTMAPLLPWVAIEVIKRRGGTLRLGVSLETHVKIWYQKLKLKLSYE